MWVLRNRLLHILHIVLYSRCHYNRKWVRKTLTHEISIFQVTIVEEGILNLFSLPHLRNGSTLIRVNSINTFKHELLPLICVLESIIFNIFDAEGLKLFTRLRLGFRYLNENRFRQSFQKCLSGLYTCGLETENICNYLLHCNPHKRID